MTRRMQSCVDHIKTSVDVDPWAMELVEQVFTEYDARFDRVLEIIDYYVKEAIAVECLNVNGVFKDDAKVGAVKCFGETVIRNLEQRIISLKGGDNEC